MNERPDVVVLDYGFGNVRSASRALERVGARSSITRDPDAALAADGLLVPGVGAFGACMQGLEDADGPRIIRTRLDAGRAVLGICVGLQVLFDGGQEHGFHAGLGLFPGRVSRLRGDVLPHMGWNTVATGSGSVLLSGLDGQRFYFVHSYGVLALPATDRAQELGRTRVSWAEYGQPFVAAIERGPLMATQFHPEKSGDAGLDLLRNWTRALT